MAPHEPPDPFYRLGAAILAAIAGLVVGLVVAFLTMAAGYENTRLGVSLLGGTIAGFLSGLFLPAAAMDFVGGVTSFFIGAAVATIKARSKEEIDIPEHGGSGGFQFIFFFGLTFAAIFWALF